MPAPPTKPSTLKEVFEKLPGYEEYKSYGAAVKFIDKTTNDTVGYSGKFPNPLIPEIKPVGWRPVKAYRRYGAAYRPSGLLYGEQTFLGQLEWCKVSFKGNLPSVTYLAGGINLPFTNQGAHPWMTANDEARVITECLVKVGNRKVDYGEALGESIQTVNHIAHTLQRVLYIFLGLKRRDPKLLLKGLAQKPTTKAIAYHRKKMRKPGKKYIAMAIGTGKRNYGGLASATWLEYQYAWLPLLSDIKDSYDLFNKGLGDTPQLIRAVRQLESEGSIDTTVSGNQAKGAIRVTDRCILFYKFEESKLRKLGQLGLINPLEVAWALNPYSFVIDWLVPVGNFLQALTATIGLTFVDGCLSRKAVGSRTIEVLSASTRYPYKREKSSYRCQSDHESFERKKIISPPLPGIYFKNPFTTKHVTSAAALLAQLSRR